MIAAPTTSDISSDDSIIGNRSRPLLVAEAPCIAVLVPRATAKASEVDPDELRAGARRLRRLVGRLHPAWVAVVGVTAYRTAFGHPTAKIGPQDAALGAARVWVLPNPSGLNAHYTPAGLAAEFARLREAAMSGR